MFVHKDNRRPETALRLSNSCRPLSKDAYLRSHGVYRYELQRKSTWRPTARRPMSPAVLPDLLADQAIDARLLLGDRHDLALRPTARDLEYKLGADRFLEFRVP